MNSETPADEEFSAGLATGDLGPASYGVFSGSQHFTVAGGTYTNITKNYHTASPVPSDLQMIRLRDIDLQREICLERHSGVVDRQHDRQGVRRMYSAKIEGRESSVTVAVYQGDGAEEEWRRDVAQYMAVWHPNIVQIFGTAKSGNIHATILHDELIPLRDFLYLHLDSPFATVYIHLHILAATRAVGDYLDLTLGHRQSSYFIGSSPLRVCADLVPGGLFPAMIEYSQPNENFSRRGLEYLGTPNMKTTVIESLKLEQYHQACSLYFAKSKYSSTAIATTVNLGAIISSSSGNQLGELVKIASLAPVQFDFGRLHWRAYGWEGNVMNDGWARSPRWKGNAMDDGWTRFDFGDWADIIGDWKDITISLEPYFDSSPWLSQASALFIRLGISSNFEDYVVLNSVMFQIKIFATSTTGPPAGFLFLCPPEDFEIEPFSFGWPDYPAYWSLDPSGAERPSAQDANHLGFPSVGLSTVIVGSSWDATVYDALREFHQGKGFDPDSQDVARHLGYPLYQLSNDIFPSDEEESHSECDSNTASTDDSEEAPASVENGDVLCSEPGHDSSNMTASARGHAELPASESADREEEADPSSLHGNPLAVSTTLRFLMYIQLALILFLAVFWLYDQMQRDGLIFSFDGMFHVL